eukprot:7564724-Karenia_brevis.AAC.1
MMKGFVFYARYNGNARIASQEQIMTQESQEILELSAAEGIIQHGAGDEQSRSFIGGDYISGIADHQHSPLWKHADAMPQ